MFVRKCRLVTLATLLMISGLTTRSGSTAGAASPPPGFWEVTGNTVLPLPNTTLTVLPNGKVLKAGGSDVQGFPTSEAELYDPITGTWRRTGDMPISTTDFTVTLLASGKVLAAGGGNPNAKVAAAASEAELYDPSTGKWTSAGNMSHARRDAAAALLPGGKVLVAGGSGGWNRDPNRDGTCTSADIYDPATNSWSSAATIPHCMVLESSTPLANGNVLFTGFDDNWPCEGQPSFSLLYDPSANGWGTTGRMTVGRGFEAVAAPLPNGQVLETGGATTCLALPPAAAGPVGVGIVSTEVYDATTSEWAPASSMGQGRYAPTATALSNGDVLVVGGADQSGYKVPSSAEIYDPQSGTWAPTAPPATGRMGGYSVLLKDSTILVASGCTDGTWSQVNKTIEVFSTSPLPTPASLFLNLQLAQKKVKAGKRQTVTVGTVPNTTAVEIMVRFPKGKSVSYGATSDASGSVVWSFKQPRGETKGSKREATVTVTVAHGAQAPITRVAKYEISGQPSRSRP
jgi:hypothetical protein